MPPRVFISYRRDDSAGHAGRLYDSLAARLGADQLFVDVDNIEPGQDFVQRVQEAVSRVDVLLAVIGKDWLNAQGDDGSRRLDNPEDLVRVEVEAALQRSILVIPVLVEGARMPNPSQLPGPLQPLARREASVLNDLDWKHSVERLVTAIDEFLSPTASPIPPQTDGSTSPRRSSLAGRRPTRRGAVALFGCIAVLGVAAAWIASIVGGGHPSPAGVQELVTRIRKEVALRTHARFEVKQGCNDLSERPWPPPWASIEVQLSFTIKANCGIRTTTTRNRYNRHRRFVVVVPKEGFEPDVARNIRAQNLYSSGSGMRWKSSCRGAQRYPDGVWMNWWIEQPPCTTQKPTRLGSEWHTIDTALRGVL